MLKFRLENRRCSTKNFELVAELQKHQPSTPRVSPPGVPSAPSDNLHNWFLRLRNRSWNIGSLLPPHSPRISTCKKSIFCEKLGDEAWLKRKSTRPVKGPTHGWLVGGARDCRHNDVVSIILADRNHLYISCMWNMVKLWLVLGQSLLAVGYYWLGMFGDTTPAHFVCCFKKLDKGIICIGIHGKHIREPATALGLIGKEQWFNIIHKRYN